MIGADDFETFFDDDEFGCTVQVLEPSRAARSASGMWGEPVGFGRLQLAGNNSASANIQAQPDMRKLQLPNDEVPENWKLTKIVADDAEYSIAHVAPLGRLRSLLTLVPYGDRVARVGDQKQNGWLPTKSRA